MDVTFWGEGGVPVNFMRSFQRDPKDPKEVKNPWMCFHKPQKEQKWGPLEGREGTAVLGPDSASGWGAEGSLCPQMRGGNHSTGGQGGQSIG